MALQIDKEIENTGLVLSYNKIDFILFEKGNPLVEIRIGLYASKEASQAGNESIREYFINIPVELFIGEGNILQIGYSLLKAVPEFDGAIDV